MGLFGLAALIAFGSVEQASAQTRDPFSKPVVRVAKKSGDISLGKVKKEKPVPPPPIVVVAPSIQQRIEGYKVLRMRAIEAGIPVPKPTTVLTIDEMQVLGIFRTPRGAAAMVEATPIKLTYTIYPGEKFYDGQLVAIEENRAVFRRTVKMSDGKVITSAENKGLKVPALNEMSVPYVETASNAQQSATNPTATVPAASVPQPGVPAEAVPLPTTKVETASTANPSAPVATDDAAAAPASDKSKKGSSHRVSPRKSGKTTAKNAAPATPAAEQVP